MVIYAWGRILLKVTGGEYLTSARKYEPASPYYQLYTDLPCVWINYKFQQPSHRDLQKGDFYTQFQIENPVVVSSKTALKLLKFNHGGLL